MKKEKKGKGALLLSVIITIVCICICIYITKNRVTPSTIINRVKTEMKIEVDITDTSIKKDLSNKIDYLLYGKVINEDYISSNYLRRGEESIDGDIFEKLNNETKTKIVLDMLYNERKFKQIKNQVTGIEDVDSNIRFIGIDSIKQINVEEVEKNYKSIFGNIEYTKADIKGCINYYYDHNNKVFYSIESNCINNSDLYVYTYKTNYRKIEDTAFVDVFFGYVKQEKNNYVAYKDFNLTKNIDIDDFTLGNKFMNEDNYKEFEYFRFNFKLDSNNNYYFTYISK